MKEYLQITPSDNVVVALTNLTKGDQVDNTVLLNDIKKGHKIAIKDIKQGDSIIKYGYPIGYASENIKQGQHLHLHNVKTSLGDIISYDYAKVNQYKDIDNQHLSVNVYERNDGQVGIRNELWVIPTVGCINNLAKLIVDQFKKEYDVTLIDDVVAYTHPYGCSQLGGDLEFTKKTLQNMVRHPNNGGVLVLGLGCENNQISDFKQGLEDVDKVRYLITQEVDDEIEEGVRLLAELYESVKNEKRVEKPISCLKVGLKCGGSDAFSGISANPLVGLFSDFLISQGGSSALTEVPEMFGAETILMNQAKDEVVFNKIVKLINEFKLYYKRHDQVIYENPSPGNKEGGITTLEEKSLGCTQKAGRSDVVDVLFDNERISQNGLNLLNGPGNDLISVTNLAASGCHMVLFTTGRGTPFGGFVPTLKIATNTDLANRKTNWIDFDAGAVLSGTSFDDLLAELVALVIKVANGQKTRNETHNFKDISIFKSGVIL